MSNTATPAQAAFIKKLAHDLKIEAPLVQTKSQASKDIETLLAQRKEMWEAERAAKKAVEQDALELVTPWTEGRVKVAGEVIAAKEMMGDYGVSVKVMVRDEEGRKVWMTCPKSLLETATIHDIKGRKVSGVVTLKPTSDDPHFAFGSRPAGFDFLVSA